MMGNKNKRVVIIGGGSAGTACAFHLRKLNKDFQIEIMEKSKHFHYSPCALPYALNNKYFDPKDFYIFKEEDYSENNIKINLDTEVKKIDKGSHKLELSNGKIINYDFLVITTGSSVFCPRNLNEEKMLTFRSLDDLLLLKGKLDKVGRVAIIGAGFVGVELAGELVKQDKEIIILEAKDYILPDLFDEKSASLVSRYLISKGVIIKTGVNVEELREDKLILENGEIETDLIINATGFRSELKIAKEAGLDIDKGILVNEYLQTSDDNIFSAGDVVEFLNNFSNRREVVALGSTAVKQAKIVAENINGTRKKYWGTVNPFISKIGDLFIGGVGFNKEQAIKLGIDCLKADFQTSVLADYYSSKDKIFYQLIADRKGLLKGGRIISSTNIAGRINVLALALEKSLTVSDLVSSETCYNPASAPIFDPQTITAEILQKRFGL